MISWLLILIALWTYPIIGFLIIRMTKTRLVLRSKILKILGFFTVLPILGLLTDISTTVSVFDWFMVTIPFLMSCALLWLTQYQNNWVVKILGIISMVLVFGIGYLSSTVGILGVGFITAEIETDREKWFDNGLIYKEITLGNAIADYRGKRIEINRTINWLPLFEWQVTSKEYFNLMVYGQPLDVDYDPKNDEFLLNVEKQWGDSTYYWNDTIRLKNN